MWRVWLKEQWYDIRYAHKSLWVSILVLAAIAAFVTWDVMARYADHEIAKRDELIAGYKDQNNQLRALIAQKYPQSKAAGAQNSGAVDDKINAVENDLNNAQSQAGVTYRDVKQKATDTYNQKMNGR